ncbi:MAG: formylglycine-generating enzyme family protein [Magnetococcus sp. DMHC-1]|nr:formylglycine-generating enzyme family protein [Magnetococcales bacterium]
MALLACVMIWQQPFPVLADDQNIVLNTEKKYTPSFLTDLQMVWVPEGCFHPDEPPHPRKCVQGFWLGKTEVTQSQWTRIMGNNPSLFKHDAHPVERVSVADIRKFIDILNTKSKRQYRLPTVTEWEYACQWHEPKNEPELTARIQEISWFNLPWKEGHRAVGTKPPNRLGLHDMSGNVWEWLEERIFGKIAGKIILSNTMEDRLIKDKQKVRYDGFYIVRGGGWNYTRHLQGCGCQSQKLARPFLREEVIGFRLALSQ